jgi:mannose/fructose/N-acetylgalactosamine-specific phosphotransferase system component IIC
MSAMIPMFIFLFTLALVLEASVKTIDRLREFIKHAIDKRIDEGDIQKLELLILSILTTVCLKISLIDIAAIGVMGAGFSAGIFGCILTALVIGRGANVFHDLVEKLQKWNKGVNCAE